MMPEQRCHGAVLVVEDDDDIREDLADVLREEGYAVVEARDGAEALACLRCEGPACCLVLLDLMMPGMDGWQFRAEQQKDSAIASIPVVLLSGAADLPSHVASLAASGFIAKPFKLRAVLEQVEKHCRRNPTHQ